MNIEELKRRRQAVGAALEDVAALIGVRASTVSRWERGAVDPHALMLRGWVEAIELLEERVNARADIDPEEAA